MFPIVFAHGLEGSPQGRKIQHLRSNGFEVIAPDGRGLALAERLVGLEKPHAKAMCCWLVAAMAGWLRRTWRWSIQNVLWGCC